MKTIRFLVQFLALAVVLAACGLGKEVDLDKMVDLGTHSLHIRCVGSGKPAVVIDTGHGDEAVKWHGIQDQLAADSRVCSYDRAGYGRSESGPMPRHSRRAAGVLDAVHAGGRQQLDDRVAGGRPAQRADYPLLFLPV